MSEKLTLQGQATPKVVIFKSESHKLHQAFVVADNATIVKGMPVKLDTDGKISPYTGTGVYLGVAVTDSVNPAYKAQRNFPLEVTVAVEGFAIVNAAAAAAIEAAGFVKPTADVLNSRYVKYSASASETNFIALNGADEANELIQVLVK